MQIETKSKVEELSVRYQGKKPIVEKNHVPKALQLMRFYFKNISAWMPQTAANFAMKIFQTPQTRAKHSFVDEVIESAQLFQIVVSGKKIQCYAWGNLENPSILLAHGWESRGTALRSFVKPLLAKGFCVITFDGPAHGDSEGQRTNTIEHGSVIKTLLNQYKMQGVIAHSFGGSSTIFAMYFLDKSLTINNLVLVGVPSKLSLVFDRFAAFLQIPNVVMQQIYDNFEKRLGIKKDEVDYVQLLGQISAKRILVVHDKSDDVIPFAEGEEMAFATTRAQLLVTDSFGHYRIMKEPQIVQKIVDFTTLE